MEFPTEIWDTIFAEACDLRGRNAAAISQVSRYFRQTIAPYRLRSLVIYGEKQIVAFHEAVKKMPPDVPRAKHLFIGLIPDSAVKDTRPVCDAVIDGWAQHRGETQTQRDNRIRQDTILSASGMRPEGYTVMQKLMAGVTSLQRGATPKRPREYTHTQQTVVAGIIFQHSMTLQTFTYLSPVSHISFKMFGRLPHLKDLTIVCLHSKSTFYEVHHSDPLRRQAQFPSLERLHLSCFDAESLFRYDEFRPAAPNLRHLRLSGCKCDLEFEKFHPHTKVLVQMILMSSQEQRAQVFYVRRILSDQRYRERVVLLEPGHREDGRYGFFDALLDWLDVSTGGNAFWGAADQVTIDELAAR
jgi:hypothetical protein